MTAALRLDPRQGVVRGVRAAVLTVPAVGAAALAHAARDGCGSPLAIVTAAGVCWPAAVALLGARRRIPALVLWLLAAQVVSHVLLERMCAEVASGHESLLAQLQGSATLPMLVAHLAAVLLTAAALSRADTGLWAADGLIRAAARALSLTQGLSVAPPEVALRTPPLAVEVPCLRDLWKASLPARRGPPVLAAA